MAEEEVKEEQSQEQAPEGDAKPAAASGEKVPLSKRVIGGVIDSVVAGVASAIAGTVGGFIHIAVGGLLGAAVGGAYMLLRDSILGNGQSIGKKVMKYQAVGPDGKPCPQELSIKRNVPFAVGYAVNALFSILLVIPGLGAIIAGIAGLLATPILILIPIVELYFVHSDPQGNRWGDKFAGTTTKLVG